MVWIGLVKGLLSLASAIASYMQDKQLLDAGAAKAALEHIHGAENEIRRAEKIRQTYRDAIAADPDKLREPDKHKRDG